MAKLSTANRHFRFLREKSYKEPPIFSCPPSTNLFFFSLQVVSCGQFVENNTFWKIQLHTNFSSNAKKRKNSRQYYFQRMGIYKDELNRDFRTEKILTEMKNLLSGRNCRFQSAEVNRTYLDSSTVTKIQRKYSKIQHPVKLSDIYNRSPRMRR